MRKTRISDSARELTKSWRENTRDDKNCAVREWRLSSSFRGNLSWWKFHKSSWQGARFSLSVSLIFVSPVLKIRPENLDADGVLICNNLMCFQIIVEHTVNFHTIKNSTISPISPSLRPCAPPAALGVVQSSRSSSDEDWKSVSRSPNMSPNGSAYRSAPCWDCQKRK